jgi:hypothetical protein
LDLTLATSLSGWSAAADAGCGVSLADGVDLLADLWTTAWKVGNGKAIAKAKLVQFSEKELEKIYRNEKAFMPSLSLAEMAESGDYEPD